MSHEFLDPEKTRQSSESQQAPSNPKVDPEAQMKWLEYLAHPERNANQGILLNPYPTTEGYSRNEEVKLYQDEQAKTTSFIVPSGWGLTQIAEHFGVTVEALKEANPEKLKTWGDVQGFNAGEKIAIPDTHGTTPKKANPINKMNQLYINYINGELDMP